MADTGNINTPDAGDLNAAARRYAASRGWAREDGSYPIRPLDRHGRADLDKAISAVGRGSGSHAEIRRHIIKRARALGLTEMIPATWDDDGTLDTGRSAVEGTGDLQYRSFTPDLEIRSKPDGRTIVGIAVPYGRPQYINPHLTEQFRRGAFNEQIRAMSHKPQGVLPGNRVPFMRDHLPLGGKLIGTTTILRDDAAGLYGEWRVSNTPDGDDTLELVKDGALSNLSIGFRERQNQSLPGRVVERVTAELREVAVVMQGAYGDEAVIAAVRAAGLPYAGEQGKRRDNAEEARKFLEQLGLPR